MMNLQNELSDNYKYIKNDIRYSKIFYLLSIYWLVIFVNSYCLGGNSKIWQWKVTYNSSVIKLAVL